MMILFAIVGSFFFGLGVVIVWDHFRYMNEAIEATGWVRAYKKIGTRKENIVFYPIIHFSGGKYRKFTADTGSSNVRYKIGDQVKVMYKEGEEPKLKSNTPIFLAIFLMIFGSVFIWIFISTFHFDYYTLAIWSAFLIYGLYQARKAMLQKGVRTWADIKEKMREFNENKEKFSIRSVARKHPAHGVEGTIVSSNREILAHKAEMAKSYKWSGPIVSIIGIGILAGGIIFAMNRYEFLEVALPASGVVVDMEESYSDDSYTYYPIVEYAPPNSFDQYRFKHSVGSNPPSYRVGQQVNVLYHPEDGNNAMIDSGIMNWFFPGLIILFGIFFSMIGFGLVKSFLSRGKLMRQAGLLAN